MESTIVEIASELEASGHLNLRGMKEEPLFLFPHFLEEPSYFKVEENDLEAVQKQQKNDDVFNGRYSVDESCEMISLVLSQLSSSNKSLEIDQLSKLFGFIHGRRIFDWKEICDHMKRTKESVTRHWTRKIVPALRDGDQVDRKFEWQIKLLEILLQDSKVTCRKDIDWKKIIQMEHFKDLTTLELRTFIGNIIQVGKRAQNEDSNPLDVRILLRKRLSNLSMGKIGKINSKNKLRKYAWLLYNHYEMHKSRLIDGIKIRNAGGEDSIDKQEGVKINKTENGRQDAAKGDWKSSKKTSILNNETIESGLNITNEGSGKCGTKKKKKKNKFDWDSAVSGILSKNPKKIGSGYKIKTLKKKLVKLYCSQVTGSNPEKVDAKVSKKLSKFQSKYDVSSDGKRIKLKAI